MCSHVAGGQEAELEGISKGSLSSFSACFDRPGDLSKTTEQASDSEDPRLLTPHA